VLSGNAGQLGAAASRLGGVMAGRVLLKSVYLLVRRVLSLAVPDIPQVPGEGR